jgi:hypothetical protein
MYFDRNMPPFDDSCYTQVPYEGYEPPKGKSDFAPDPSDLMLTRPLLEEAGIDPAEDPVAVVTNDFHIYRARLLAVRQDYDYAFGIPARLPWIHLEINYYIREAFALVKTLLFDWR